jgi:hypothetical protein
MQITVINIRQANSIIATPKLATQIKRFAHIIT